MADQNHILEYFPFAGGCLALLIFRLLGSGTRDLHPRPYFLLRGLRVWVRSGTRGERHASHGT